jgi:hypothetical protein
VKERGYKKQIRIQSNKINLLVKYNLKFLTVR